MNLRSLGVKFTAALLGTSLISLILVGGVVHQMLFRQFNQRTQDEAFENYRGDVTAYFTQYGSWTRGEATQPFEQFRRARHRNDDGPGSSPASVGSGPQQPGAMQSPSASLPPQDAPDGGPGGFGGGPGGPSGDGPPPPEDRRGPMFNFALLAPDGTFLLDARREVIGQQAPDDLRDEARPIIVKGKIVALAVERGEPILSPSDRRYLGTIQHALLVSTAVATLLALGMGLLLGNRLSKRLRQLTSAFDAMGQGQLRQQIPIDSHDEIGVLAQAFNQMSAELAAAHENLQASHHKIEQQAALLKEISARDGLTGIYNRRYFDEQVTQVFAQAKRYHQPLTLMVGDIDLFKRINDTFSHAMGDEVLRRIALLLQNNVRTSDIVARYGGEEFALALPQTPLPQAVELCERLRQMIAAYPWHELHPDLKVTMSMGLSADISGDSCEKTIALADAQLYEAKHNGRNRVCFAPVTKSLPIATQSVTYPDILSPRKKH